MGNNGAYKFTAVKKKEYLDKLKEGIGRCKAAVEVGLSPRTVERELVKGNGFIQARTDAEEYWIDRIEESYGQAAVSGNVVAAKHFLEVKRPDVWAPKKEPVPGSSPQTPLYVAPGNINWDAIPDDLADELLALNAKIVALQPASGGLIINQDGSKAGD